MVVLGVSCDTVLANRHDSSFIRSVVQGIEHSVLSMATGDFFLSRAWSVLFWFHCNTRVLQF